MFPLILLPSLLSILLLFGILLFQLVFFNLEEFVDLFYLFLLSLSPSRAIQATTPNGTYLAEIHRIALQLKLDFIVLSLRID